MTRFGDSRPRLDRGAGNGGTEGGFPVMPVPPGFLIVSRTIRREWCNSCCETAAATWVGWKKLDLRVCRSLQSWRQRSSAGA